MTESGLMLLPVYVWPLLGHYAPFNFINAVPMVTILLIAPYGLCDMGLFRHTVLQIL